MTSWFTYVSVGEGAGGGALPAIGDRKAADVGLAGPARPVVGAGDADLRSGTAAARDVGRVGWVGPFAGVVECGVEGERAVRLLTLVGRAEGRAAAGRVRVSTWVVGALRL